ncbi:centrosomal protein [Carex rostrata]
MSLLWEKSPGWRWLVRRTRDSKPFFFTFAALCGVVPGVIGFCVMQATNTRSDELESHLRRTSRPESNMMGQVNKERLAEFLGEIQRKEDTNDRYVAALKGETLTRKPYVRIQPVPNQTPVQENKTKDK